MWCLFEKKHVILLTLIDGKGPKFALAIALARLGVTRDV
jgi:hypothetical protein